MRLCVCVWGGGNNTQFFPHPAPALPVPPLRMWRKDQYKMKVTVMKTDHQCPLGLYCAPIPAPTLLSPPWTPGGGGVRKLSYSHSLEEKTY